MNINNFSLLLKQYIHESQYNVVTISKLTGIPRTTIQKYMSGIQMPASYGPVEKIIKFLSLSIHQKNELKKAYFIEKVGYSKQQKLIKLKSILNLLNDFSFKATNYNIHYNFQKTNNFAKNPEELKLMVHFILEDALKTTKKVQILMNSDNDLSDIIYFYAKNNPDLMVEQIVNLKKLDNDIDSSNLNQFQKLLPLMLLDNKITIKYMYSKIDNTNFYSIFPYTISSRNYVLLINSDYSLGMLADDDQKYLKNEFNKKSKFSKQLFYKSNNTIDYLNSLFNYPNAKYQIFSYTPFFIHFLFTSKQLALIDQQTNEKYLNFKEAIDKFIKTNKISLFFSIKDFNNTLKQDKYLTNKNNYKKILNNIIENHYYNIHVFNDNKISFPNNLTIITNQNSLVFFFDTFSITIYENTICHDFLLLDLLFEIEEYCFKHDESIKILNQIICGGYDNG